MTTVTRGYLLANPPQPLDPDLTELAAIGTDGYAKRSSGLWVSQSTIPYADLDNDAHAGLDKAVDPLAAGFCTISRVMAYNPNPLTSGSLRLSYFTAPATVSLSNITVATSSVAAAATPTLIRFGLYSVAGNGDLTLVASTASDTTLLAAATTAYTKALSAAYSFTKGTRYAWGVLVVSGSTMPYMLGSGGGVAAEFAVAPRWNAALSSQSDLPSTITSASLGVSGLGLIYARFS